MSNPAPIGLDQLFRFYRGLPHQLAAISELEDDLRANGYAAAMRRDRPWFAAWSQDGKLPEAAPTRPAAGVVKVPGVVPYFPQQDNGPEGWRQCQSSAIAMCLAYLRVPGIRDDLDYLKVVRRFGDTTSQAAHQQALRYLQAPGRFTQMASVAQIEAELQAGRPCCLGVLHHGPVTAPTGGGHWIVAYGYEGPPGGRRWLVHDPYGELDLVRGGWTSRALVAGEAERYSYRNLNPRVWAEGPASGWAWTFGGWVGVDARRPMA
jgi:hypothetical protein